MKIIIASIITLLLFQNINLPQTRNIKTLKISKEDPAKSVARKPSNEKEGARERIPGNKSENNYERKPRKPIEKPSQKNKLIEAEEILIEEFEYAEKETEPTLICSDFTKDNKHNYHFNPQTDISRNPYQILPIRFAYAEVHFLNTKISSKNYGVKNHYYELNFCINLNHDPYFHSFGILIKYANGDEKLMIFNKDEEVLLAGETYKFKRKIKITQFGYMNLLIGFYDELEGKFYQEKAISNKNDFLLYVQKPL